MSIILYFVLIHSSTAFILKHNGTSESLISYSPFDDSLSLFEDDVAAADCACENGRCVRDNRGKWKCLCRPRYALQGESKCAECDCGNKGKCFFNEKQVSDIGKTYEKKCLCDKDFAEKDGKCISCVCGKNSKCEFEDGEKICYCEEGFSELNGACEECNCGDGGVCEFRNAKKHCTCHEGFLLNGEKCEECDCGNKGTCAFVGGIRTCHCEENYLENFGICQECNCGEHSTACKFDDDGEKRCSCVADYAQNEEEICSACNCGEPSTGCSFPGDGTKQCLCNDNHAQNSAGQCEMCMCGDATESCLFGENNEKLCTCKPGYAVKDGLCTETCTEYSDCLHGSSCEGQEVAKFCNCKKGLEGDKCEIVADCAHFGKYENCRGDNGSCVYNVVKERAECLCSEEKILHPLNNICQDCNCGDKSTSCTFNAEGSKLCTCERNYAQNNAGVCVECTCGGHTASCHFGPSDDKKCICEEEYAVKNGICTEICYEDSNCLHGGSCKNEIESKFCDCRNGISGAKCDVIDDCAYGKYQYCHEYNGTCEYNIDIEKAICSCPEGSSLNPVINICQGCNCGDKTKACEFSEKGQMKCTCEPGYAPIANICTETCNDDEDCKNGGSCVTRGDAKFCQCREGVSGTKCEIIHDCTENGKYKNCFGENGKCSYDVSAGKAVCSCSGGKKLNPITNICEECECGHKEECEFIEDGSKTCSCLPGFALLNNRCTETCNSDADCLYMGICEDEGVRFCKCKNGLSGDKCDVIDDCSENGKYKNCQGVSGSCGYDLNNEKAICKCPNGKELNTVENVCQDCNCGENGKCSFNNGLKVCNCTRGTAEKNGICEVCDCGEGSTCKFILQAKACDCMSGYKYDDVREVCRECNCGKNSNSCAFRDGKKVCQCSNGYQQRDENCEACDCGKDALGCSFVGNKKSCSCPEGFFEEDEKCQKKNPCDPNPCINGRCTPDGGNFMCVCQPPFTGRYCEISTCVEISCFGGTCRRYSGIETCICPEGQQLINGHCKSVNCRPDTCYGGRCELVDGILECVCPPGYHLEGIGCFGNQCKHQNCFGGTCIVLDDHELCTCPDGYSLRNDVCELILCEKKNCFGGKCSVVKGEEVCTCPKGFEIKDDVCELIARDECELEE